VPEGSALAVERAAVKGKAGAVAEEKVVSPAIAGPGFINVRVSRAWVARHIQAMLRDVRARAGALWCPGPRIRSSGTGWPVLGLCLGLLEAHCLNPDHCASLDERVQTASRGSLRHYLAHLSQLVT